jgi:hypothetical protein
VLQELKIEVATIKDGFISLITPIFQLLYFIPFTPPPLLPKTNIKETCYSTIKHWWVINQIKHPHLAITLGKDHNKILKLNCQWHEHHYVSTSIENMNKGYNGPTRLHSRALQPMIRRPSRGLHSIKEFHRIYPNKAPIQITKVMRCRMLVYA